MSRSLLDTPCPFWVLAVRTHRGVILLTTPTRRSRLLTRGFVEIHAGLVDAEGIRASAEHIVQARPDSSKRRDDVGTVVFADTRPLLNIISHLT